MTSVRRNVTRRLKRRIGNEYFESLFHRVPEAIALCDNKGHVIKVNAEFRRMFGYTQAEACGRSIDDLIAPDDLREDAIHLTNTGARGEMFSAESIRRRKDRTPIHVSILGAPIHLHGRLVAVYGIYRDITDRKEAEAALLESQRKLLETYASLQQRSAELEEANALLEQLSKLDALTSIPNRRFFEDHFRTEWRRACREESWIGLIMIDVDLFKSYNDLHGHLAGDECLRDIAAVLAERNRAGDLVARYGGEEFVALLGNSTPEGTLLVAERLRQRVEELCIPHGGSPVSPHVTISLGVAAQRADAAANPTDLLLKADQALYKAKTRGRNRVESAHDALPPPLFPEEA